MPVALVSARMNEADAGLDEPAVEADEEEADECRALAGPRGTGLSLGWAGAALPY
jgi:hypothetical protein